MSNHVRIYWNLHKKCWSVQDRKTGRVIRHETTCVLSAGKFVVRKAGQEKVRREGKKNVHAFVRGEWLGVTMAWLPYHDKGKRVTYNPYKYSTFVEALTDEPIHASDLAVLWKEPNVKPKIGAYTHE